MHTLNLYRGTVVSCRYAVPRALSGPEARKQLRETFESAIARAVLEHPLLQVGLVGAASRKPAWTRLESIDFRNHVDWKPVEDTADLEPLYQDTIQQHLDTEFTDLEARPGWRIAILHRLPEAESLDVVYSWNHANHDGMGAKIFHQTLLRCLNEVNSGNGQKLVLGFQDRVLTLPASTIAERFTPTQHELVKFSTSTDYVLRGFCKESLPAVLTPKRTTHAAWAPIQTSPYKTPFRTFSLDAEGLGRVLSRCRQHGTTLTGLFHALALVALAAQLDAHEAPGFEGGTALSMRRFLPSKPPSYPWVEPDKTMGNFVSTMGHVFGKEVVASVRRLARDDDNSPLGEDLEEVMWEVAATVRGEIENKIKTGVRNDIVGLIRFVTDWRTQLREMAQKPREHSWIVTNLGVLDGAAPPQPQSEGANGDGEGDSESSSRYWSIDHAEFVLGSEVSAAALLISPIAVKGRDLVVAISWQDCVVETSFGDRFVANVERWIRHLAAI